MPIIRSLRTGLLAGCLSATLILTTASPVYADVAPAPALLLAKVASGDLDPAPYWVSEKLDGVRALWDGELWIARNRFEQVSGIVRRQQQNDADWRQVRYMIFELPDAPGSFTARIEQMRAIVSAANVPWLHVVEQFRVNDQVALMQQLDRLVQARGEGLMLHLAAAPYLTGRQDALLKLKPWQDTEATVVGYTPGTGKYRGMTGALKMQMPDGKHFLIGSGLSDAVRRNPPAIGSLVTYRHQALTQDGVPRFARYLRLRVND